MSVSITSQSFIETAERIELVFGMDASFNLSNTVLKGNLGISKKGAFPGTLPRTLDSKSIVLSTKLVDGRACEYDGRRVRVGGHTLYNSLLHDCKALKVLSD